MEDRESQVMEVAACDRPTARKLLQENGDDPQAAIMAFYSREADAVPVPKSQDVVPYQPISSQPSHSGWTPPPSETPIGPHQQGPAYEQNWGNYDSNVGSKGERTSKKRNTPIDLTGDDEDDDLRKAMQASLESESSRQKRQQEYGYRPRGGARATNDDDEALTRAIEASMQQNASSTQPQSPQNPPQNLESLGAFRMRTQEEPVTVVSPSPFMRLFAVALQALYAATPFRQAFMSLKLCDLRLSGAKYAPSMDNYWQGNSPSGEAYISEDDWQHSGLAATDDEKEAIDGTMRLLTLFVFLTLTKRPLCMAEDVISHPIKSNYAYVMNSSRRPASDIVSCHVQATLETLFTAIDSLDKQFPGTLDDCRSALRSACLSFTAMAVTPQSEEPKQMRRAKDSYEVTVHQLIHNNVNTSVHKALYAHLAEDKSLYTSTSSTLFLSLSRLGANSLSFGFGMEPDALEDVAPFEVESKLFLDQFMFEQRNGVRLGLDSEKVKGHLARIEELERYRKRIGWHQGTDSRSLLRGSLAYFEQLCSTEGADQVRLNSIEEAKPRLARMLAALEKEVAELDAALADERQALEEERKMTMTGFLDGLRDPELQNICYDLQAVMMNDEHTAWAYVRHSDGTPSTHWWKVCDGQQERVTEEDVLRDPHIVHFLIYTRHEQSADQSDGKTDGDGDAADAKDEESGGSKPKKTIRLDSGLDWWAKTALAECIEMDNAAFGTQLAQAIRSGEPSAMVEDTVSSSEGQ